MITTIYVLLDPATKEIRYVGKTTKSLNSRLKSHMREAKVNKNKHHRSCWLRSLNKAPLIKSIFECADDVDGYFGSIVEQKIIKQFKAKGFRLTNSTDGGEGKPGCKASIETKKKLSNAAKGRKQTSEWIYKRTTKVWTGKQHTPEAKAKMSLAKQNMSQETKEKIRQIRLGTKASEETRVKLRAIQKARKYTPEQLRKLKEINISKGARKRLFGVYKLSNLKV